MAPTRDVLQGFVHLIFPAVCNACGQALRADEAHFCHSCRSALVTDPFPTCPHCGATVGPYTDVGKGCPQCRDCHFCFDAVVRLGPYDGLLREVILRIKHSNGEGLAENLALLWADHAGARIRALGAQVIVPVPLHWWRRLARGYNQCDALAHALSERLGLPWHARALRRIRATPKQTLQTPSQRRANVRGAFRARTGSALRGRSVLLVDDVMTTGSTCHEAARALREAGAVRVIVAVLARGQG